MAPLKQERILVIDDDESIRDLLVMSLEGEGYKVVAPKSPSRARKEVAKKGVYPVIIHDVMLWDGYPGTDSMRQCRDNNPGALLIVLTAIAEGPNEDVKEICTEIECKPFDLNELLKKVERGILQRGHQRIVDPRI